MAVKGMRGALTLALVMMLWWFVGSACGLSEGLLTLPRETRIIGEEAFYKDASIQRVEMPDGVKEIQDKAFACSGLQRISLSGSITYIADNAFDGCEGLMIDAPAGTYAAYWVEKWRSMGGSGDDPDATPAKYFTYSFIDGECHIEHMDHLISEVVIPRRIEGRPVVDIGKTFKGKTCLTRVVIPEGVREIPDEAFQECWNLSEVVIPEGVRLIGKSAFANTALACAVIPKGVTRIDSRAFYECEQLTQVVIPDTVRSIGEYAFCRCPLDEVAIPECVTQIGAGAFWGSAVRKLTLSEGLESIGNSAFGGCSRLTRAVIPDSVVDIGTGLFISCGNLADATVGDGVTVISEDMFSDCKALETIRLSGRVARIEAGAFAYCTELTRVEIPSSVAYISDYAFTGIEPERLTILAAPNSIAEEFAQTQGFPVDRISGYGCLEGRILDAVDESSPVPRAKVTAYAMNEYGDMTPGVVERDGSFQFTLLSGAYRIVAEAEGYAALTDYVEVRDGETSQIQAFLMVSGTQVQTGYASGRIIDAITGAPVSGARIDIREGWDNVIIVPCASADTDAEGRFRVQLPIGSYTAAVRHPGYAESGFNLTVIPDADFTVQDYRLVPAVKEDQYRIVLEWGDLPKDLDAHLDGRYTNYGMFQVSFMNRQFEIDGTTLCTLDVDDREGNGREVITLTPEARKPFYFYVHRFTDDGTISTSGAQVTVFKGSQRIRAISVPINGADMPCWNVFALRDGEIILRNTFTEEPEQSYAGALIPVTVSSAQPILYMGTGQECQPDLVFSDGLPHNYFSALTLSEEGSELLSVGDDGGRGTLIAKKDGETFVDCDIWEFGEEESYQTCLDVCVVYRLPESLEMCVGQEVTLNGWSWIFGDEMDFEHPTWRSDDPSVAQILRTDGVEATLRAVNVGNTVVRMRNEVCGAEARVKVTVGNRPTRIDVNRREIELGIGEQDQILVSYGNGEAWYHPQFESRDANICEVSETGELIGVGEGRTSIVITAGSVKKEIIATVGHPPEWIEFVDKQGDPLTTLKTLRGFRIALPEVRIDEGAFSRIHYDPVDASEGAKVFYQNQTITASTYNGLEATLQVEVENNTEWERLREAKGKYDVACSTLRNSVHGLCTKIENSMKTFDSAKKAEVRTLLEEFLSVTNTYTTSGVKLPEAIVNYIVDQVYNDLMRDIPELDKCETELDVIHAINKLCFTGEQNLTFTCGGVRYTYTGDSLGSSEAFAISLGTISDTHGNQWPMVMTFTPQQGVQSFMNELKRLAEAKINAAWRKSIMDGRSVTELNDLRSILEGLAKTDPRTKEILLEISGITNQLDRLTDSDTIECVKQFDILSENLNDLFNIVNLSDAGTSELETLYAMMFGQKKYIDDMISAAEFLIEMIP